MFKANSKNDAEFMLESLKSGLRLDGRGPLEYREMSFAFGKADGQVMVQIGRTVIYITLSTVVVDPFVERAREGIYRINVPPWPQPSF
ncbi:MAG: hypothetical protein P4M11_14090 [Candidatus Pacebacteria bacterium]|nr:hypothetical protein [Candidatus Paceibacterota bacterium]